MIQYLDWETEFAPEEGLTLKKMTTWEYVRSTNPIVVASADGDGPVTQQWASPYNLSPDICAAHNASFDASVSREFAGHTPKLWLDTAAMVRYAISQGDLPPDSGVALANFGDKLDMEKDDMGEYVTQDVEILRALCKKLLPRIPPEEIELIDLHVQMASDPVLNLDSAILEEEAESITQLAKDLRKDKNFAYLLEQLGEVPETKQTPKLTKYAFAKNDSYMKGLLVHSDERIRWMAAARLAANSSINRTRAQRMLNTGQPFPVPLKYYGAHTGRSSGSDKLNLQNFPRGGGLRRALKAPPGHKLVICDSSQIEPRVLAYLAGQEDLLEIFRSGRDPYREFGALMYDKPASSITALERALAKAAVLALGYGQGHKGYIRHCATGGITVSVDDALAVVRRYRGLNADIRKYWYQLQGDVYKQNGILRLPSGRKLIYPDLQGGQYTRATIFSKGVPQGERQTVRLWHGMITENYVQAYARDVVMLEQTLKLAQHWRVVLSVHDEAVMCVPEEDAEECKAHAIEVFSTPPEWAADLPVAGKAEIADNYGTKP